MLVLKEYNKLSYLGRFLSDGKPFIISYLLFRINRHQLKAYPKMKETTQYLWGQNLITKDLLVNNHVEGIIVQCCYCSIDYSVLMYRDDIQL